MSAETSAKIIRDEGWSDPASDRPVPFWEAIELDVTAHVSEDRRTNSRLGRARQAIGVALRSSGFHVTTLYRVAHLAYFRLGLPGKVGSGLIFWFVRHFYTCSIASSARLHGGLILPHPQGIVIGAGASVGPCAWIFQNVTIGGMPGRSGLPRVGRDARIYAGAVLAGPIVVGDSVIVGANAVVTRDIPSRSAARSPAPEIGPLPSPRKEEPPALAPEDEPTLAEPGPSVPVRGDAG